MEPVGLTDGFYKNWGTVQAVGSMPLNYSNIYNPGSSYLIQGQDAAIDAAE